MEIVNDLKLETKTNSIIINTLQSKNTLESSQVKEANTISVSDHEIDVVNDSLTQMLPNNK